MSTRLPVADAAQIRAALRQDVRSDRRAFAGMLVLNALAALAALVGPAYLGRIVDEVTGAHPSVSVVNHDALIIVVFALAQILVSRWALLIGARFGERTSARIRERMLERALSLPASVVEHTTTGDLVSRGTNDAGMVAATLRDAAPIIFVSAVQVLCIAGAVLVLNPLLGICGVACLVGDVFVLRWYLRRSRPAFLAQSIAGAAITDVMESTASGARTVDALGLEQRRIEAAETAFAASIKAQMHSLRLRLVLFPTVDASYVLPLAAILLIGGALYEHGEVSLGAVVASTLYMRQLAGPLDTVLVWIQTLQNAAVSYARVEGLSAAPQAPVPTGAIPAGDRIEVAGAHFAYNADHGDVLHGVDLVVQPGERLAIVGASGAGKSTLGRLLAGIDHPNQGTVTVDGIPIADLPPERLRRQVVLVTQEHHVFHDTLRGNLKLAKADATDDELLAALGAVDAGWIDALPDGLDTFVAGNGHRLDGAQAQQLALARVVLADPHTVILDEATALLDPATARNTEQALAAVLRGRTVIAIAHRLQTAHDADRVAVMDAGLVTELGTHEELVASEGTYAALWRSWHRD
ncbi:ABC transporter ATP-binding protein [Actinospica sp.]|uniref:ABC transporter ATP-binding protein n=1 Tax=Actinospica sp. TaxID=1872142 RepID=UPI002C080D0D|nr:ABC transporter ATP-binding protein [Actinospica sp.]HWG27025.1 ABC transporter ATP-binding protein [Actinospica sp.]